MHWYCIHTRPLKEEATAQYCRESIGLETYCPRLRETKVIRRVRRSVTRPLFPRYLFCRFEPALHYRAVRYAPDAIDVVHCGRAPTIVSDDLIHELKGWIGEALEIDRLQPALNPGDMVVIEQGPLMGLRAVVQSGVSDSERVTVLLSCLDWGARSVIPRNQLRLVS